MRTRAYRPEATARLEDRSLLSAVAGPSADPIVLTRRQFNSIPIQIQSAFTLTRRGYSGSQLHDQILDVVVRIPYGRVDGLGVSIDRILKKMQHDIAAKVPDAITTARNDVIAVVRADAQARAQSGDLVVR